MELATYGAYGICLVLTLILILVVIYVKGSAFATNLVFYLLLVVSFITRESFALTNDGGGKKSPIFFLMIFLVSVFTLMGLAAVLFSVYLLIGHILLRVTSM